MTKLYGRLPLDADAIVDEYLDSPIASSPTWRTRPPSYTGRSATGGP